MADKIRFNNDDYDEDNEPTDSEDEYSEEEKELIESVRKSRRRDDVDAKKEIMAFDSDDDDEDDEDDDVGELMGDSDIEGAGADNDDDIPDSMDWGKKSRNYYNTDFVDPDYSTYNEQEEELAKQEEEEAKAIQLRLAKQMREEDFLLDDSAIKLSTDTKVQDQGDGDDDDAHLTKSIKMKADMTGLSKRERQRLFQKDSPEFAGLMNDFKEYLEEAEKLITPVLSYAKQNNVPMIPALEFAQLYQNMILTYCSNVTFYLLLKAKRIPVRNHPITKRLLQLKKLIDQLQDKHDNIIKPQLEALLERIEDGDEFEVLEVDIKPSAIGETKKKKTKAKLGILDDIDEPTSKRSKLDKIDVENAKHEDNESSDDDAEEGEQENIVGGDEDADIRRGITYQIAKNKGLMPHRKKELRNPRVKHRSKFRKALIRRKGAVRTVRKETKRYGGEISGIKAGVTKSIKFRS